MTTSQPRDIVESALTDILRSSSGIDLSPLDRKATFLELGFDSLFLIQFSQRINKQLGVKVSFRQMIEELASIETLVDYVTDQLPQDRFPSSQPLAAPSPTQFQATPPAPVQEANPNPIQQQRDDAGQQSMPLNASPHNQPAIEMNSPAPQPVPINVQPSQSSESLAQIIAQQNQLMALQLQLLSGTAAAESSPAQYAVPQVAGQSNAAPAESLPDHDAAPAGVPAVASSDAGAESERKHFGPYKPVRRAAGGGLTDPQRQHIDELTRRLTSKTQKSREHAQRHRPHFADPRGVAGYRRIWKSMVYQISVERSHGSKLWDIDGNEYTDIAMGFGLNLFGQSPEFITEALQAQLRKGVEVGPQSPLAGEVAQLLCDMTRKDRATFCNTGSEAVMGALRIARTVTGKSKVVFFNKDYHGNFDEVLLRCNQIAGQWRTSPAAPGVPVSLLEDVTVLPYGAPESLDFIRQHADELAAVLVEPVQSADPFLQPREFLQEVRRITAESDVAMIMDEVITGFRAAQGGAQEYFDVWADIATYGKILGGGLPIGAIAGSSRFMDALDGGLWHYEDDSEPVADMTFFAGTFVRHPMAMAAAHQVLMKLKEEGPELQQELTEKTKALADRLNHFFESEVYPIRVAQFASQFRLMFPTDLEYADLLYFHLLDRGIFMRGWEDNCFLSTAHSDEEIEQIIQAIQESCRQIRGGGFMPKPEPPATSSADSEIVPAAAFDAVQLPDQKPLSAEPVGDAAAWPVVLSFSEEPVETMSTIIEIQENGSRTPLFCMPAADGLTLVYHELSEFLGPDQPVFGLNSPGVYKEEIPDRLEALAARFIQDMREIQPRGPYLIIGYCSGGTTAIELARQLIESGEQVAMLACVETYNWLTAPWTHRNFRVWAGYQYERLKFHLLNFLLLSFKQKQQFLASKHSALRKRTRVWYGGITRILKRSKPPNASLVNMADIWKKHDEIAEAYVPPVYPGELIHFRPCTDYRCYRTDEVEAEQVKFYRLRNYPAASMVPPFVEDLAKHLQAEIDRGLEKSANSSLAATR